MEFLNANDALSTLAGSISNSAVTANLAIGTGALFPDPGADQYFVGTFISAGNPAIKEIVHVTARVGDTITMVRGQEGTAAVGWTAGDAFQQRWTAGQAQGLLQLGAAQAQDGNYAVDTGATNAYVVTLDPPLTTPVIGMPIRMKVANAPTGASTFNPGPGAAALRRANLTAFIGGEWAAGEIVEIFWNGTQYQWDGLAIASAAAIIAGTDAGSAVSPSQLAGALGNQRIPSGQCYFQYTSPTACKLIPHNGNAVPVAGQIVAVPAAGISVANTGITLNGTGSSSLGANANYLVALGAGGALEFWTLATGHSADTTSGNIGVEIISGHATKSLVGMVRTNGSSQFVDTDGSLFVLSWFNRKPKRSRTNFTGSDPLITSSSFVELDTSIRNTFLVWADGLVSFSNTGAQNGVVTNQYLITGLGFDGTTAEQESAMCFVNTTASSPYYAASNFNGFKPGLSEGNHYATLLGKTDGNTASWVAGTTISGTLNPNALSITVQG